MKDAVGTACRNLAAGRLYGFRFWFPNPDGGSAGPTTRPAGGLRRRRGVRGVWETGTMKFTYLLFVASALATATLIAACHPHRSEERAVAPVRRSRLRRIRSEDRYVRCST